VDGTFANFQGNVPETACCFLLQESVHSHEEETSKNLGKFMANLRRIFQKEGTTIKIADKSL
jgi:hypothetical protein